MKTGNFEDYVYLDDETEIEVYIEWEGYVDGGNQWTPAWSEMEITKIEPIGDWPEGLSKEEFDRACKRAEDRHLEAAWELHNAE